MDDGPKLRGDSGRRYDPYRQWHTGILVELAAFTGFAVALIGMSVLLAVVFGG